MTGDPNRGDGRNVDPELGLLAGEAAQQAVPSERAGTGGAEPFDVWTGIPSAAGTRDDVTYYERPVLKEPTWIWAVPVYFWVGGAAGAAAVLGAAAQSADRTGLPGLTRGAGGSPRPGAWREPRC